MAELWKAWKAKGGLPPLSTSPLGISPNAARFPHFHSSGGEGGWKSGKPTAGFPLPHRPGYIDQNQNTAAGGLSPSARGGAPRRLRRNCRRSGEIIVADRKA